MKPFYVLGLGFLSTFGLTNCVPKASQSAQTASSVSQPSTQPQGSAENVYLNCAKVEEHAFFNDFKVDLIVGNKAKVFDILNRSTEQKMSLGETKLEKVGANQEYLVSYIDAMDGLADIRFYLVEDADDKQYMGVLSYTSDGPIGAQLFKCARVASR